MEPNNKADQPPAEASPQMPVPPSLVTEEQKTVPLGDTTGMTRRAIRNMKTRIRKKALREPLQQEDKDASRENPEDTHVPDVAESSAQGLASPTSTISPNVLRLKDKVALPALSTASISSSGSEIYYTPESGRSAPVSPSLPAESESGIELDNQPGGPKVTSFRRRIGPRTEASVYRCQHKKRRYRERFKLRKTMSQFSSAQERSSSARSSSAQKRSSSTQKRSSSAPVPGNSHRWTEVKNGRFSDSASATIPEPTTGRQSPAASAAFEVAVCLPSNFSPHEQRVWTPPRPATSSIDTNNDTSTRILTPDNTPSYQATLLVDATATASQSSSAYHPVKMPSYTDATAAGGAGDAGDNKAPNGVGNNEGPNGAGNSKGPNGVENNKAPNGAGNSEAPNGAGNSEAPGRAGSTNAPNGARNNKGPGRARKNKGPGRAGSNKAPNGSGNNQALVRAEYNNDLAHAGYNNGSAHAGYNNGSAHGGYNNGFAHAGYNNGFVRAGENFVRAGDNQAPGDVNKKLACPVIVDSDDLGKTEKPKDPEVGDDLSSHGVECSKPGCGKRCAAWDYLVSICPACGPFSSTRYCTKEHLREDVKNHWSVCGRRSFQTPVKKSSFPSDIFDGPPMIPFIDNWSSPERHRQAMWYSTGQNEGDYFVFADLQNTGEARLDPGHFTTRCQPTVLHAVRFHNEYIRDMFRRCLAVSLFISFQVPDLVDFMYRLLRDHLRSRAQWTEEMAEAIYKQFWLEFHVDISESSRHACVTEWGGYPEAFCQDPICINERGFQFFDTGAGRGYERLCLWMEAQYWILRANRFTHPTCSNVEGRIYGVGYDGWVPPTDRRLFRRGEGWDGAGTGPMEIEYVSLGPRTFNNETIQ
ncbi:hypothetical protein N7454_000642 [Penicillium verhagenii]|nr:hypothetical protein N7454_000642 [Penicillium verhagenii]